MTVTNPETQPRTAPQLPEELVASATFLLKRLGYAAKERTMKAYEGTGLHPYHHAILLVLDAGSADTQGSIADALGYDRGQLVGLLDELEEQGLIERRRDPDDRRRYQQALARKLDRKVNVNFRTDPSVVGGAAIQIGDHLVDGTVRTQLARLRQELLR